MAYFDTKKRSIIGGGAMFLVGGEALVVRLKLQRG